MLEEHLDYVTDAVRRSHFIEAIARSVKPGDRVVDLGTGSGVLALLCLQAGASHVDAIDSSGAIELARGTLQGTGWRDRVALHHALTSRVTLEEKADVIICDHVGYFGFDYGLIELLADARRRFLKPSGVQIPSRLRPVVGAVESAACRELLSGWAGPNVPREFHWIRSQSVDRVHAVQLKAQDLVAAPRVLAEIDLKIDHPAYFQWTSELTIGRTGQVDGLCGWFDCELAADVWMSNSPMSDSAIQRPQAFLPFDQPLTVEADDILEVTVMARPSDDVLAWQVHHPRSGERRAHSTLSGTFATQIRKLSGLAPDHVPRLSSVGEARRIVLGYCDGKRTRAEIHALVLRDHPDLLPSREETARFVNEVLANDTAP